MDVGLSLLLLVILERKKYPPPISARTIKIIVPIFIFLFIFLFVIPSLSGYHLQGRGINLTTLSLTALASGSESLRLREPLAQRASGSESLWLREPPAQRASGSESLRLREPPAQRASGSERVGVGLESFKALMSGLIVLLM